MILWALLEAVIVDWKRSRSVSWTTKAIIFVSSYYTALYKKNTEPTKKMVLVVEGRHISQIEAASRNFSTVSGLRFAKITSVILNEKEEHKEAGWTSSNTKPEILKPNWSIHQPSGPR